MENGDYAAAEDVLAELVDLVPGTQNTGCIADDGTQGATAGQAQGRGCALVMRKYGWLLYTKRGKRAQGQEWLARAASAAGAR